MEPKDRIVTQMPLMELWDETGVLAVERGDALGPEEMRRLVRVGAVRFVVAEPGKPLRWIRDAEHYVFWNAEVRPHLVAEPNRPFDIDRYPDGYAYGEDLREELRRHNVEVR